MGRPCGRGDVGAIVGTTDHCIDLGMRHEADETTTRIHCKEQSRQDRELAMEAHSRDLDKGEIILGTTGSNKACRSRHES